MTVSLDFLRQRGPRDRRLQIFQRGANLALLRLLVIDAWLKIWVSREDGSTVETAPAINATCALVASSDVAASVILAAALGDSRDTVVVQLDDLGDLVDVDGETALAPHAFHVITLI